MDGLNSRALVGKLLSPRSKALIWAPWRRLMESQQVVFEHLLGIRTRGRVDLPEHEGGERVFYVPCQWLPVRRALRTLRPQPADTFVDLGCGMGQAVLIAGRLPFGRAFGVEFGEELSRVAAHNIEIARPKLRAGHVEAVTADARDWPIPDDLSVIFMYCPFQGELFAEVLTRCFAAYDAKPRPLRIVYLFPSEHNWLIESGRVAVRDVLPAQWPPKPWWWRSGWVTVVYEVVGAGEAAPVIPAVRRRFLRPRRALARWAGVNDQAFRFVPKTADA